MDSNVNFDVHRDCKAKLVLSFKDGKNVLRVLRVSGSGLVTSREFGSDGRLRGPEVVLKRAQGNNGAKRK